MTRFLKLVRHEDGKWKALPNETDDLAQVSHKERTYAPIDPDQLLKALDSLLSAEGGIKSVEDVPRLASLMKKFSKKLVSRCVYCNVLQATEPNILSEYLDKGGWETINVWLQYAKSSTSPSFLVEMLKLCSLLPMTLERLKENNTAKLIKSMTKHEKAEVKTLANELVTKWMTIIKDKKSPDVPAGEKKKKEKKNKATTEKKEKVKEEAPLPKPPVESPKAPVKLKGTKRPSSEKETKKAEFYEDVKIDPEPLLPAPKKLKPDRPKTAKVYQKKFRSTGLEEETPLPKKISKKNTTVDKTAAVAAAKNVLKFNSVLPERITEKKLKPETLAAINENSAPVKGIKLIPAKPRPAYVLQESGGFMDALISQPAAPVKRKKKVSPPNKSPNSPTSPTMTPPKLQFYKDTLEMNDENAKKEESEKENASDEVSEGSPKKEEAAVSEPKNENEEPMEVTTEDGEHTPPNNDSNDASNPTTNTEESKDETEAPLDPNQVRSILSHGRRRGKKKSVQWVEEENIKEIFYFELDENERVNVLKTQNFGDMKSMDLKKEREAIELSKRQMGDKMEEMTRWWITPVLIDRPPPLAEFGCQSKEKEVENTRQQSTLQEIYFTKEMIPDSPHEPDLEIVPQQEPKVIPLDEGNIICNHSTYDTYEPPAPAVLPELPECLSSLMKSSLPIPQLIQNNLPEQMPMDTNFRSQPLLNMDPMNQHNIPMQMTTPYDPAEPLPAMQPNSLLGPPPNVPNMYGMSSPPMSEPPRNMPPQNEWRTLEMVQDPYYGGYPGPNNGNHNMMPPPEQAPGLNLRPRMMLDNFRPPMHKGPPRGMGPRGRIHRVPCRHFIAGGCRFGMKCSFLHPGVNGPPM